MPKIADNLEVRGMGVMWGIDFGEYSPLMAYDIRRRCFEKGVILELCGSLIQEGLAPTEEFGSLLQPVGLQEPLRSDWA